MDLPLTDRPPDEVIEDDDQLDRWVESFIRDQARRAGKAKRASNVDKARQTWRPEG